MIRLRAILTWAQIQQRMADVRFQLKRKAEQDAERKRLQQELSDEMDEDAAFFTGLCHVCERPVGPRMIFCKNCLRKRRVLRNAEQE